jgi:hypothetical protein
VSHLGSVEIFHNNTHISQIVTVQLHALEARALARQMADGKWQWQDARIVKWKCKCKWVLFANSTLHLGFGSMDVDARALCVLIIREIIRAGTSTT